MTGSDVEFSRVIDMMLDSHMVKMQFSIETLLLRIVQKTSSRFIRKYKKDTRATSILRATKNIIDRKNHYKNPKKDVEYYNWCTLLFLLQTRSEGDRNTANGDEAVLRSKSTTIRINCHGRNSLNESFSQQSV